jgi:hypothetical protein
MGAQTSMIALHAEEISQFIKHHPFKNTDMDPREFVEFFFVYKADLEELWRYLNRLGIKMNNFTIEQLQVVLKKEELKRQSKLPNVI